MTLATPFARRILFHNARVVDPASGTDHAMGWVLIEGATILDLGTGTFTGFTAESIDCGGKVLCPGLIDSRVHLGEPGAAQKETIAGACATAVASGITTLIAAPDTNPPIDSVEMLEFVARRARRTRLAKVESQAALTRGCQGRDMTEMGLLAEAGALAFGDGPHALADAATLRRALAYASTWDLLVTQMPQDVSLTAGIAMTAGETALRLGLKGQPREAEVLQLDRDLRLAAMTGARYHAAGLTTAAALDSLRRAKDDGLRVTADATPIHALMTDIDVGTWRTFAKLYPPLRPAEDREAVIAALADGTLDILTSDHRPQDQESKRLPFAQAEFGAIGIDTLLSLVLKLVKAGHLDLIAALRTVTANPARVYGLPGGRLAKGAPADLILFDPDRAWRIDEASLLSTSKNTPFDGQPAEGRTLLTLVDGRPVFAAPGWDLAARSTAPG